ncbi:TetR/AcrR family transcriptional regulator [Mycolicibacterium austroafricanum]|nr:TetR family transcriptional regulator [Mycolicibacterium austroafricanum]QRZ08554.1 TetR family transcriptional regulator [Mycolicibacterium austroafricanum]QZT70204.1 TetR/AcrR family transcriptional regulator [Mycolicibacterium austroafricanum]
MSAAVIPGYDRRMSRWQPNARERLEQAALELYTRQGFDQTTVDDIAQRAGLTERTFFRHFADKREVLFSGQAALIDLVTASVAAQEDTDPPLDVVAAALTAAGSALDGRGDRARQRQAVIDANPGLRERELIKLATLADTLAEALRQRGVEAPAARLAADVGLAVFRVAFERWVQSPGGAPLPTLIAAAFADLRRIVA